MPSIVKMYDIPVTAEQGRSKLRQEFLKNKHVRDIRSIDLLVIKVGALQKSVGIRVSGRLSWREFFVGQRSR